MDFSYSEGIIKARDVVKNIEKFGSMSGYLIITDGGGLKNLHQAMNRLAGKGWRVINMTQWANIHRVLMFREPTEKAKKTFLSQNVRYS